MDYKPTTFFILENEELNMFWISQINLKLDESNCPVYPGFSKNELTDKLESKYGEYTNPTLDLLSVKKDKIVPFYGIWRWLVNIDYKIKQNPKKYEELETLLTSGWHACDMKMNSTVHVLHINNTKEVVQNVYRKLLGEWEARGMKCLNTKQIKSRSERYKDNKKDPDFLYKCGRADVIRQMKKTGKKPKPSTIEKYGIKVEELELILSKLPVSPKNFR